MISRPVPPTSVWPKASATPRSYTDCARSARSPGSVRHEVRVRPTGCGDPVAALRARSRQIRACVLGLGGGPGARRERLAEVAGYPEGDEPASGIPEGGVSGLERREAIRLARPRPPAWLPVEIDAQECLLRGYAVRKHAEQRTAGRPVPSGAPNRVTVCGERRRAQGEREDGERNEDSEPGHDARIDYRL